MSSPASLKSSPAIASRLRNDIALMLLLFLKLSQPKETAKSEISKSSAITFLSINFLLPVRFPAAVGLPSGNTKV